MKNKLMHHLSSLRTRSSRTVSAVSLALVVCLSGCEKKQEKVDAPMAEVQENDSTIRAKANSFNEIANAFYEKGEDTKAIGNYLSALRGYKQIQDTIPEDNENIIKADKEMAFIYWRQGDLEAVKKYLEEAFDKAKKTNNMKRIIDLTALSAELESVMDTSETGRKKVYDILQDGRNKLQQIPNEKRDTILSSIEMVYLIDFAGCHRHRQEYTKAKEYIAMGIHLAEKMEDTNKMAGLLYEMGDIARKENDLTKAYDSYQKGLECGNSIDHINLKKTGHEKLQKYFEIVGDREQAYHHQSEAQMLQDSLITVEKKRAQEEFQTKEKEQQITLQGQQLARQDAEIKQKEAERKKMLYGVMAALAGALLVTGMGVMARRQYKKTKKKNILIAREKQKVDIMNAQLGEKNKLLEEKNEIILQKSEDILDSINYAERIQHAIVPSDPEIKELFPQSFILFQPKDIVSGDYYRCKQVNDRNILAAIDCTGHGVPGAFLSMLAYSFLNEIVENKEVTEASQVLNLLRQKVIKTFGEKNIMHCDEDDQLVNDGMDISLIAVNYKKNKLQYAGAKNDMYMIRDGQLKVIKADRMSISHMQDREQKSFTNHEIDFQNGDTFYLSSDGYRDQFGGNKKRGIGSGTFKQLLTEFSSLPMTEQKEALVRHLDAWKGDQEQIDDVLVVGVKV